MKTYPILNDDGTLRGFEITSSWIRYSPLLKILSSVEGVECVSLDKRSDDRITFVYKGFKGVVHEPFGDNSRYWIGLDSDANLTVEITCIHNAFKNYQGLTVF